MSYLMPIYTIRIAESCVNINIDARTHYQKAPANDVLKLSKSTLYSAIKSHNMKLKRTIRHHVAVCQCCVSLSATTPVLCPTLNIDKSEYR